MASASATGRSWNEWVSFLDEQGARNLTHKEIVAVVAGAGGLENGWWQQSVAVGYEQARGLRVVGQTSGADFQIGVQKTLPLSSGAAWDLLVSEAGRAVWLGKTADIELTKGAAYQTEEGHSGEIRSCLPGQRIRLTWSHPALARTSTLQLTLTDSQDRTSVRFHQEQLSSPEEREKMRNHWRGVLNELQTLTHPPPPSLRHPREKPALDLIGGGDPDPRLRNPPTRHCHKTTPLSYTYLPILTTPLPRTPPSSPRKRGPRPSSP